MQGSSLGVVGELKDVLLLVLGAVLPFAMVYKRHIFLIL